MTPADAARQFWAEGYVHIPGFFDADLMDRLTRVIEDHFGAAPDFTHTDEFVARAQTEIVPWFPQREGVSDFDPIEEDRVLLALTKAILGEGWISQYCMVMFSKKGTAGQAWHQDCPPEEPGLFNLNRLIYTSDIVDEIGGQVVIAPGSHLQGELPAGEPHGDLPGQVALRPKKGDLLLIHGHAWHRVLPIREKYRFSTNFRAAPRGVPDDVTDVCVYRTMRYRFSTREVLTERAAT